MFDLFYEGGPLFMGILTILLFIVVLLAAYFLYLITRKEYKDLDQTLKRLKLIKSTGVFALTTGILGQLIGLYAALSVMQKAPISSQLFAAGFRISMITVIYGVIIFLISYLLWALVYYLATKK